MSAPVTVTAGDREAAKSLLGRGDAGPSWWSIDSGNADSDPMVQAFARHRLATEAASAERVRVLEEALGSITRHVICPARSISDADLLHTIWEEARAALRLADGEG